MFIAALFTRARTQKHKCPSTDKWRRAPKSQLMAEQPWQEDAGAHQKRFPHPRTKKNPQWDGGRIPYLMGGQPTQAGEQLYHGSSPHWSEGCGLHVRLPSQPGSLATGVGIPRVSLRASKAGLWIYRTRRNGFHSWRAHRVSCAPGSRGDEPLHWRLNHTHLLVY